MNYSNPKTVESEPSAPISPPFIEVGSSDRRSLASSQPLVGETEWATGGETGGGIFFLMKVNRRSNEGFIASPVGTSPSSFLKAGNESI